MGFPFSERLSHRPGYKSSAAAIAAPAPPLAPAASA
jgi:hypothetical protein